ncbi:MAG: hypothetical protein M1820_005028 [Bogoriella megaspora]|nr:MAG: hypothetical protein M1820_005028 [Bogoriella megaspora]
MNANPFAPTSSTAGGTLRRRYSSIVSPHTSRMRTPFGVRDVVRLIEGQIGHERALEAGFGECRRGSTFAGAINPPPNQRRESETQTWWHTAEENQQQVGWLKKEIQDLKEQLAVNATLPAYADHLEQQLDDKNAQLDELEAEKQLVIEPYLEELESEIEGLKAEEEDFHEQMLQKDKALEDLAHENAQLRNQLQMANGDAPLMIQFEDPELIELHAEMEGKDHDLRNAEKIIKITEERLKNTESDLEIARHHLQLRKDSIAALQDNNRLLRRESVATVEAAAFQMNSPTEMSLLEAEISVRNQLEMQFNSLQNEVEALCDEHSRKNELIDQLGDVILSLHSEKRGLTQAHSNLKLEHGSLTSRYNNLEQSHKTLRECLHVTQQAASEQIVWKQDSLLEGQRLQARVFGLDDRVAGLDAAIKEREGFRLKFVRAQTSLEDQVQLGNALRQSLGRERQRREIGDSICTRTRQDLCDARQELGSLRTEFENTRRALQRDLNEANRLKNRNFANLRNAYDDLNQWRSQLEAASRIIQDLTEEREKNLNELRNERTFVRWLYSRERPQL